MMSLQLIKSKMTRKIVIFSLLAIAIVSSSILYKHRQGAILPNGNSGCLLSADGSLCSTTNDYTLFSPTFSQNHQRVIPSSKDAVGSLWAPDPNFVYLEFLLPVQSSDQFEKALPYSKIVKQNIYDPKDSVVVVGGRNLRPHNAAPSPDGKRLAYMENEIDRNTGDDWNIVHVKDLAAGSEIIFPQFPCYSHQVRWTRNGTSLSFVTKERRGFPKQRGTCVWKVGDKMPTFLSFLSEDPSPDGALFAYPTGMDSTRVNNIIDVLSFNGQLKARFRAPGTLLNPVWNGDSRRFYFLQYSITHPQIMEGDITNSQTRSLVSAKEGRSLQILGVRANTLFYSQKLSSGQWRLNSIDIQ